MFSERALSERFTLDILDRSCPPRHCISPAPTSRSSRTDIHGRTQGTAPMKLTRAQVHCLIELYGYTGPREPREGLVLDERLYVKPSRSQCGADLALVVLVQLHIGVASLVLDGEPMLLP